MNLFAYKSELFGNETCNIENCFSAFGFWQTGHVRMKQLVRGGRQLDSLTFSITDDAIASFDQCSNVFASMHQLDCNELRFRDLSTVSYQDTSLKRDLSLSVTLNVLFLFISLLFFLFGVRPCSLVELLSRLLLPCGVCLIALCWLVIV